MKALEANFRKLTFNETYLKANPDNFISALHDIKAGIVPKNKSPMYVASATELFRKDTIFRCLSQFGPNAPSAINRGGAIIKIPRTIDDVQSKEGVTTTTQRPEEAYPHSSILIAQKVLDVACTDMKEMISKKHIMQDPKERAKSARNLAYEGETLKRIWAALSREIVGVAGAAAASTAKAKTAEEIASAAAKDKALKELVMEDF
jgi:hypothetical protein